MPLKKLFPPNYWDFEINSIALKDKQLRESLSDAYKTGQDHERDRWLACIDQMLSHMDDVSTDGFFDRFRPRRFLNALIRRTNATRGQAEETRMANSAQPSEES